MCGFTQIRRDFVRPQPCAIRNRSPQHHRPVKDSHRCARFRGSGQCRLFVIGDKRCNKRGRGISRWCSARAQCQPDYAAQSIIIIGQLACCQIGGDARIRQFDIRDQ